LPKPSTGPGDSPAQVPVRPSSSSGRKQLGGELPGTRSTAATPTLPMKAADPGGYKDVCRRRVETLGHHSFSLSWVLAGPWNPSSNELRGCRYRRSQPTANSSEAPPWFSLSPRQANWAGTLPVIADELGLPLTGRRRSPLSNLLRPRQPAPRHCGELLVLLVFSILSILIRSIIAPSITMSRRCISGDQ
jgi:hypothetical protein